LYISSRYKTEIEAAQKKWCCVKRQLVHSQIKLTIRQTAIKFSSNKETRTEVKNMALKKSIQGKTNSSGNDVSKFLDELKHPLRKEIDQLRRIIQGARPELEENIKWNGPNFMHEGEDRITMRIHPPTQIQLVFHRGAAVKEQPSSPLVEDNSGLLLWKSNDRAVATLRSEADITKRKNALTRIVNAWIDATFG
jgi:hypothetical protein